MTNGAIAVPTAAGRAILWTGLAAVGICLSVVGVTGPVGVVVAAPLGLAWLLVIVSFRLNPIFRVATQTLALIITLGLVLVLADGLLPGSTSFTFL